MPLDEVADRRAIDKRRIARDDDDRVDRRIEAGERRQPGEHGARRPVGLLLHRAADAVTRGGREQRVERAIRRVDHDNVRGAGILAAAIGQPTSGRPASSWSTFGVRERMRVPRPAARTRTAKLTRPGYRGAGSGPRSADAIADHGFEP